MSSTANAALAEPWKDLWNGNLSLTEKIIAEDFVAHAEPTAAASPARRPRRPGREVTFTGTDGLRIADGMLAEYWGPGPPRGTGAGHGAGHGAGRGRPRQAARRR